MLNVGRSSERVKQSLTTESTSIIASDPLSPGKALNQSVVTTIIRLSDESLFLPSSSRVYEYVIELLADLGTSRPIVRTRG